MIRSREHALGAGLAVRALDSGAVGCNDPPVGHAERLHALPDADYEGNAGEESKRLAGEPRGGESRWDDRQRAHGTDRMMRPAANCTICNLRLGMAKSNGSFDPRLLRFIRLIRMIRVQFSLLRLDQPHRSPTLLEVAASGLQQARIRIKRMKRMKRRRRSPRASG